MHMPNWTPPSRAPDGRAQLLGDETERRLTRWLAKIDPAFLRTPRAAFWISTLFYVFFLVGTIDDCKVQSQYGAL